MKHPLLVLLIALLVTWAPLCALDVRPLLRGSGASSPPPAATYLVNQRFEGTDNNGYDNSETWTTSTGSPNPDYNTTVLDPAGSHSLFLNANGNNVRVRHDFTGADTLYGYLMWRRVAGSVPAGDRTLLELTINGGTTRCFALNFTAGGALKIVDLSGGVTGTTVSTMSLDTTYHVWWSYTKGTSMNAYASCAFSTTGTQPTSGNNFADWPSSNGTSTAQGGRVWLGHSGTNANADMIFDKVLIDDAVIGSNP